MSKLNRNQKAMLFAEGIVERYHARGKQLPHRSKTCRMDPNREQEYRDAAKLNDWKQSLKGNRGTCSIEICNYLDQQIPNWRDVVRTNKVPPNNKKKDVSDDQQIIPITIGNPTNILSQQLSNNKFHEFKVDGSNENNTIKNNMMNNISANASIKESTASVAEFLASNGTTTTTTTTSSTTGNAPTSTTHENSSMTKAQDIVNRYIARGNQLPRELRDHQHDPIREQEYRDAQKLNKWKQALSGKSGHACSNELRDFLDKNMPTWRVELRKNYSDPMLKAREIVERYKTRGGILPRQFRSGNDPLRQQENKDARKLYDWKQALKGLRFYKCSDELRDYLDEELPGWRQNLKEVHTNPMQKAIDIVKRYHLNGGLLPRQYKNGTDIHRIQENKDAQKLYNWKEALNGKRGKCSDAIRDYLDAEMPGWRSNAGHRNTSSGSNGSSGVKGNMTDSQCQTDDLLNNGDDRSDIFHSTSLGLNSIYHSDHVDSKRKRDDVIDGYGGLEWGDHVLGSDDDEATRISKQIKRDSELLLQLNNSGGCGGNGDIHCSLASGI